MEFARAYTEPECSRGSEELQNTGSTKVVLNVRRPITLAQNVP
jgi:hypothetical protein